MHFGQLVIGPPGSGKTTYCAGMKQFLTGFGREVAIVNLDPANDTMVYKPDVDISDLITIDDAMDHLKLGPNGGLVYCMEYLESNISWLMSKLDRVSGKYLLFDCPGQVELYTHNAAVRNIVSQLVKRDIRLVAVHLVDSHYCSDASKFISVLLTSLSTMLQMELPHVNVLSKCDLIEKYGKLSFNLDFYTEVLDLSYILDQLKEDEGMSRYKKLNAAIVDIVQDYSLVSFIPLIVEDRESMLRVLRTVDKANGYVYGDTEERSLQQMLSYAVGAEFEHEKVHNVQEKYVDNSGSAVDRDANHVVDSSVDTNTANVCDTEHG